MIFLWHELIVCACELGVSGFHFILSFDNFYKTRVALKSGWRTIGGTRAIV
jgi:hypothetical protein